MELIYIVSILLSLWLMMTLLRRQARNKHAQYIDTCPLPARIRQTLQQKYPHLNDAELDLVLKGLREYFHLCNQAGNKMVSMPSQVVDIAWHEFILFTRQYQHFCKKAFGRFLHHTPAEAMPNPTLAQQGIKRAWRLACHREGIRPKHPSRLPLLFAIDNDLAIADGFVYALHCDRMTTGTSDAVYCASHISCASGCGGSSCGSGHGSSSGCGSSCGSSCGSGGGD